MDKNRYFTQCLKETRKKDSAVYDCRI